MCSVVRSSKFTEMLVSPGNLTKLQYEVRLFVGLNLVSKCSNGIIIPTF
jgi:hypothetical protein